jgi:hypothetical protein
LREREGGSERERGRGRDKQKTERDTVRCPLNRQSETETFRKMFLLLQDLLVKRAW